MLDYAPAPSALAPIVACNDRRLVIDLASERMLGWHFVVASGWTAWWIAVGLASHDRFGRCQSAIFALLGGVGVVALWRGRSEPAVIQADDDGVTGPESQLVPRDRIAGFRARRLASVWLSQVEVITIGTSATRREHTVIATCRTRAARGVVEALNRWHGGRTPAPLARAAGPRSWPVWVAGLGVAVVSARPAWWLLRAGWTVEPGASTRAEVWFGAGLMTLAAPAIITMMVMVDRRDRGPRE